MCEEMNETYLPFLLSVGNDSQSQCPVVYSELMSWDEIEIEEELGVEPEDEERTTKTGKVKSKLCVPLVCSASVQNILYWLSQELTKNLNYTMIE